MISDRVGGMKNREPPKAKRAPPKGDPRLGARLQGKDILAKNPKAGMYWDKYLFS